MILCIETATISCSVALSDGGKVVSSKESRVKNSHSSIITVFIEEVLKAAKTEYSALKAVAVSKGPGSYTGLRIGVSTAKGICYALNIPLISVPTLEAMSSGLINKLKTDSMADADSLICPMLDARRMEVYYSIFDRNNKEISETKAEIITETSFSEFLEHQKMIFFGDGAEKCKSVLKHDNAIFLDNIFPSANDMADIAFKKYQNQEFEDTAYFEPFYLKEFVAKKPSVKGLI